MKKILSVIILSLILFSCDKQENTNIGFREPTCNDTTDEGVFESYTNAETAQFLNTYQIVPNFEVDSVIKQMYLTGRLLRNREVFYDPYLVFRLNRPADFYMYMPTKVSQAQYQNWVIPWTPFADSQRANIYNVRPRQLEPGCYRLYYVFVDTGKVKTVFTKGHFDIEIRN
jgi:hypothetical protein